MHTGQGHWSGKPPIFGVLQGFGKIRNTHPLFVRISGEPLTTKVIDYVVTGWFRRAGITPPKGALGHSLRHTYATLLIEQGGSVHEASYPQRPGR